MEVRRPASSAVTSSSRVVNTAPPRTCRVTLRWRCTVLYYSVLHITWMVTVSGVGVARSPSTLQATPHTSPRIRVEVSAPPTAPCGGSSTECFSRYRGGFRNY